MASSDLKGLGNTEGPPVVYHWTPPNLLPRLLPWLAMLVLLVLPRNRTGKAWWIWLPLAVVSAAEFTIRPLPESIPSELLDYFCTAFTALAFGIAAVWLLTPILHHRLRFVVFLKLLATVGVVTAFSYLMRQEWDGPALGFVILAGVGALTAALGLSLAGLVARRQYRPLGLTLWLALLLLALWLVAGLPFFVIAAVESRGEAPWLEFVQFILAFAGLTFGMILPFLLLAYANGFFRERLKNLLHLRPSPPPPVPVVPPPVLNLQNPL